MFGLSAGEIVIIVLVALILFGNEHLPQHLRSVLEAWKKWRSFSRQAHHEWHVFRSDLEEHLRMEHDTTPPQKPTLKPHDQQGIAQDQLISGVTHSQNS